VIVMLISGRGLCLKKVWLVHVVRIVAPLTTLGTARLFINGITSKSFVSGVRTHIQIHERGMID